MDQIFKPSDPNLGVSFVTFSGVNSDLHLGKQKVTWKKLADVFFGNFDCRALNFLLVQPLGFLLVIIFRPLWKRGKSEAHFFHGWFWGVVISSPPFFG